MQAQEPLMRILDRIVGRGFYPFHNDGIGVLVGIEGEDVVGDTDTEVSESHRHRGALVAGLHLTEEVVLATDGHRDLLGGAGRLGLGEGDDIVAET